MLAWAAKFGASGRRSALLSGSLEILNSDVGPVFGRFSAKLGPRTPLERRGSSCSGDFTKNQGAPEGPCGFQARRSRILPILIVFLLFFIDSVGFQARRGRIVPEGAGF